MLWKLDRVLRVSAQFDDIAACWDASEVKEFDIALMPVYRSVMRYAPFMHKWRLSKIPRRLKEAERNDG